MCVFSKDSEVARNDAAAAAATDHSPVLARRTSGGRRRRKKCALSRALFVWLVNFALGVRTHHHHWKSVFFGTYVESGVTAGTKCKTGARNEEKWTLE